MEKFIILTILIISSKNKIKDGKILIKKDIIKFDFMETIMEEDNSNVLNKNNNNIKSYYNIKYKNKDDMDSNNKKRYQKDYFRKYITQYTDYYGKFVNLSQFGKFSKFYLDFFKEYVNLGGVELLVKQGNNCSVISKQSMKYKIIFYYSDKIFNIKQNGFLLITNNYKNIFNIKNKVNIFNCKYQFRVSKKYSVDTMFVFLASWTVYLEMKKIETLMIPFNYIFYYTNNHAKSFMANIRVFFVFMKINKVNIQFYFKSKLEAESFLFINKRKNK